MRERELPDMTAKDCRWERLSEGLYLCVGQDCPITTDGLLLSDFAQPKPTDIACDLGSGCGLIPARWFRQEARSPQKAYGVELWERGVAMMQASVSWGGLPEDRFFPVHGDLRRLALTKNHFDLVTCNPPYYAGGRQPGHISRQMARHEGICCTLEDVGRTAWELLKHGGRFCLCQKPERLADVMCTLRAYGLEPKRLRFVQHTPTKKPWLFLLEAKKGGRPSMTVEPPLWSGDSLWQEEQ